MFADLFKNKGSIMANSRLSAFRGYPDPHRVRFSSSLLVAALAAASAHAADYNWTGGRDYRLVISEDGTKLYLSMQSGTILLFR